MSTKKFRTIGRAEVFAVKSEYLAAGDIPTVVGQSIWGKLETVARVADVVFLQPWEMDVQAKKYGELTEVVVKKAGEMAAIITHPCKGAKWHVHLVHAWSAKANKSLASKAKALAFVQDAVALHAA